VTKSFANSSEVMVSWVGMKMACLERQSMTTRMEEYPLERGRCSMNPWRWSSKVALAQGVVGGVHRGDDVES